MFKIITSGNGKFNCVKNVLNFLFGEVMSSVILLMCKEIDTNIESFKKNKFNIYATLSSYFFLILNKVLMFNFLTNI